MFYFYIRIKIYLAADLIVSSSEVAFILINTSGQAWNLNMSILTITKRQSIPYGTK